MHTHDIALEIQNPQTENLLINGDFSDPSPSLMAANRPTVLDCPKPVDNPKPVDSPKPVDNSPKAVDNSPKAVDSPKPVDNLKAVNNPKAAKTPRRQWAAWTRQEEENFFSALRQVGKNFDKITCRVQSKNKNQVRHYYYRLVRRMNKLLGPGLSLDAKNSKDTVAAMLRWWSLLEKHSCTASKLHLKPRRLKIFVDNLENQLMKDRNKSRRKRPCQGEKCISPTLIASVPNTELGNDCHPIVDNQNSNKLEANKKPSLKRNVKVNNYSKTELPPKGPTRQRRKPVGLVASAAYRRWEKAAMAGVSLVADAAEQLEKANSGVNCSVDHGNFSAISNGKYNNVGQKSINSVQNGEAIMHPPVKLKLQLFPIDEVTRQTLEKDACNPHLELTLSGRKRFSSVFERLNQKWGSSSIASGDLMLFPYSTQEKNINQQKWTKDTIASAAEVYATVGSPVIFRLRYGWFPNTEPVTSVTRSHSPPSHCDVTMQSENSPERIDMDVRNSNKPSTELPTSDVPSVEQQEEVSLGIRNTISTVDWADSLTNISIGDLFSEASNAAICVDSSHGQRQYPQGDPFSCDSFDAVISAHTSKISTQVSHTSMWNEDETCDEFSFRLNPSHRIRESSLSRFAGNNGQTVVSDSPFEGYLKENAIPGSSHSPSHEDSDIELESVKDTLTENDKDVPSKDMNLMELYWPDSLGAIDLELPASSKYQGQELLLGDSNGLGFLSQMISNSLDVFQNCSLFGVDKKQSTSEAQGTAPIHLDARLG